MVCKKSFGHRWIRPGFFAIAFLLTSCLGIHHVQIGEIDQTNRANLKPFDIKVSEMGFSIDEATQVLGGFVGKADRGNMDEVNNVVSMFQMGPKTGKPVYNDQYAERIHEVLYDECPSGKITGLIVVRESRQYPVISGEIIKILGYCM